MTTPAQDRLYELLADRALVGLGAAEEAELDALVRQHPGVDVEAFERAAAAIAIASVTGALDPMPARLAARIEQQALGAARPPKALARTFVMPDRPAPPPPGPAPGPAPPPPRSANVVPLAAPPRSSRALTIAGWIAAAACLLLAIGALVTRRPGPIATAPRPAAAERAELLAKAGTTRVEWSATKDPAASGASGDVVWNAAEQRGYMRFRGLAANDPRASQYQLWIFDKTRDEAYPVDGGVFDVDRTTGDVVVPIRAKLPVAQASLFAVTVERPGGVVVSKRERIVVTAKPPS